MPSRGRWRRSGGPRAVSSTAAAPGGTAASAGAVWRPRCRAEASAWCGGGCVEGGGGWGGVGGGVGEGGRGGFGELLPVEPRVIAQLVTNVFQGVEIELLAGVAEGEAPHRELLDALGALIERAEST